MGSPSSCSRALLIFLFDSIICQEVARVSLINTLIDKTQSSVFDLTRMWHYVLEGRARGSAKGYELI